MRPWDRVVSALMLEEPDMVPLFEMHMSPQIASTVLGRASLCYDLERILGYASGRDRVDELNRAIAEEILEIHSKLGLDFIRVPGSYAGADVRKLGSDLYLINGVKYRLLGGSLWLLDEPESYSSGDFRFEEVEEEYRAFDILEILARKAKGEFFLSFDADGSWGPIVSRPKLLRHVLRWMRTDRELVKRIIDGYTDLAIRMGTAAIDLGADAILMCVDYGYSGGPWMSPSDFRAFVKPALKRQVRAFKARGGFAILHSDGNIEAILDEVVSAGIDAYQGIDVLAGMELGRVKERYGDRICLIGNFNPLLIDHGTWEDIKNEVVRCLRQGAPGGGYIFSTSANLSASSNGENFLTMMDIVRKLRKYPLKPCDVDCEMRGAGWADGKPV